MRLKIVEDADTANKERNTRANEDNWQLYRIQKTQIIMKREGEGVF